MLLNRKRFLTAALVTGALLPSYPSQAAIGEIDVNAGPAPQTPPAKDRSTLWIESKTRATLLLMDSRGRRTGIDPKSKKTLEEIPNSRCEADYVTNPYTGDEQAEVYERLTFEPAAPGHYQVILRGLQVGPFEVDISALSRDGSSEPTKQLEGLISEGENKSFRLTYDSAANAQLTVVESAPPSK